MVFSASKAYVVVPMDRFVLFGVVFLLLTVAAILIFRKRVRKGRRVRALVAWLAAWLIAGATMFSFGVFGRFVDPETIHTKKYSKEELTADLQQLEECLLEENPLYFANRNELTQLFNSTHKKIKDGMTEVEFYRLINPLVTAVRCGHTNLSISEALWLNRKETARFFPVKVTLEGNRLIAQEDDPASGIVPGDEIISINGKSSAEIISALIANTSGDGENEAKPRYIVSKHFNHKFYDFVDDSDQFRVELIGKNGTPKTADLQARYRDEFNTTAWELHFANFKNRANYDGQFLKNHAVLTLRFFGNEKDKKFDAFLEDFFKKIKQEKITKLVIDLRGNYGGDSFMAKELLSYLTTKEFAYMDPDLNLPFYYRWLGFMKPVTPKEDVPELDVAVVVDGAVFSTAAHFTALVKYHQLGTILGGETGGTYVCTDASKDAVLNHTRLRLHYSTQIFKVKVQDLPHQTGIKGVEQWDGSSVPF